MADSFPYSVLFYTFKVKLHYIWASSEININTKAKEWIATAAVVFKFFNCKIWSYLPFADRYKAKSCEQKAWPWWKWNCAAPLVSASQTEEHWSMGISLAEAQKMSHILQFASPFLLHFLINTCAYTPMTTCALMYLLSSTALTISTFLFILIINNLYLISFYANAR